MKRVELDRGVRVWRGGEVVTGGAPWGVVRFQGEAVGVVAELGRAGTVEARTAVERGVVRGLVGRGVAHPVAGVRPGPHAVTAVVPVFGRSAELDRCLAALGGTAVVVVDDGSADAGAIREVAARWGARLVRHPVNRGPAAARNTGLALVETEFAVFVDSDCRPLPGWLDALMPCFDDPRVAAVAPRILPDGDRIRLLGRYEALRSSLDMGNRPALVRPGARLGFVPTATLVVRRGSVPAFDESLRLGEDVDLVWRLHDAGRLVRYQPAARVAHTSRPTWRAAARRLFEYGTSAADLTERHPGRTAPLRASPWNLLTLGCLAAGRPRAAALSATVAAVLLARGLRGAPPALSATIVAKGTAADAIAVGRALRREWWPLGAVCLAAAPRSRFARAAAAAMLLPVALEWAAAAPPLDPLRYTGLRLAEDVVYGSGVLASARRARSLSPLLPVLGRVRPVRPASTRDARR